MINLRYHIVSLTAVFLAIGIGVTLGSTFLDRATVENLNGQLETLATRLEERNGEIQDLQDQLERSTVVDDALDEQATGLLSGRLTDAPVVIIAARGVDEADVGGAIRTLTIAGARVQGIWWITDRWLLDDDGEVSDLALALDLTSTDPSRLRRTAITRLGAELRSVQLAAAGVPDTPDEEPPVDPPAGETTTVPEEGTGEPVDDPTSQQVDATQLLALVDALGETGFVEFEPVAGGPDGVVFPPGTRIVVGAGSSAVPDDVVIEPLVARMAAVDDSPILGVLGSVMPDDGGVSDAVSVIRQDEALREQLPTVDALEHFHGWAAMVLALADVGDGIVGHYGLDDGATRLLPQLTNP